MGGARPDPLRIIEAADARDPRVTPRGRVTRAAGEATGERMRDAIAGAVLRSERARLRRVDDVEATRLWEALVQGRFSIVEATERDGRRFLLARRNTLGSPDVVALEREESDVVWLAARGHSHKYIAYELGVSVATVARRLKSALGKLRIRSRRDLLKRLGIPPAS